MSTNEFNTAPNVSYTGRANAPLSPSGWVICLVVLFCLPLAAFFGYFVLCLASIDRQATDGPAPNANYEVRRQWGEEKLQHHFEAAEKWIHNSSQIANDVGAVTGVAPIGSPNSFGASFGESWAAMNLQVIGDQGEGVLHLPNFCADDDGNIHGFESGTWIFETHQSPTLPSGKSSTNEDGVQSTGSSSSDHEQASRSPALPQLVNATTQNHF